jgi:hypothetical protein
MIFMRAHVAEPLDEMETIEAVAVAPWEQSPGRMVGIIPDREEAIRRCMDVHGSEVQIFTDASMKHSKVGYSVVVWMNDAVKAQVQRTIGTDDRVNVYISEMVAIMGAVDWAEVILNSVAGARVSISSVIASLINTLSISSSEQYSGVDFCQRLCFSQVYSIIGTV